MSMLRAEATYLLGAGPSVKRTTGFEPATLSWESVRGLSVCFELWEQELRPRLDSFSASATS
jgi:hypothetical protein